MILLSGASGFIGSAIINLNLNSKLKFRFKLLAKESTMVHDFESYSIDIAQENVCWTDVFTGVDTVIHLAGIAHKNEISNTMMDSVNITGTVNFAKAAVKNGVKRFIFVSTIGVNGCCTTDSTPFKSSSSAYPHNHYALTKYMAELELSKISKETGLEVVIVRPTLVYGPDAPGNFGLLTNLVKKLPMLPFGLVNNKRDFISVQNLADFLLTCATHPNAAGHTFLASDMDTVSLKEFTNAIADGLGKKVLQLPIPITLMRFAGRLTGKSVMVEQLVGNLEVDSSNIKEVLGWTPPLTMKQAMSTIRDSGKLKL